MISEPLIYKRIEDTIKERILGGEYPPGHQLPTERNLVEEFNTSRLTVAKSLAALIADGYITRTRGRGTFVCDPLPSAESPEEKNADWIRFISPKSGETGGNIRHGLLEGLYDTVAPAGGNVGINFYGNAEEEAQLLQSCRNGCSGMVIWPEPTQEVLAELRQFHEDGFRFVLVDSCFAELACDSVLTDNTAGAELMIGHLYNLGHRRIAYLSIQLDRISLSERFAGVITALSNRGLPVQGGIGIIPSPLPSLDAEFVKTWLDTELARPPPPTAIFCSNDVVAHLVIQLLREQGIRVPEMVSVAGFDNVDRATYTSPGLTTIAQDFYQMGRQAGNLLMGAEPPAPSSQYRIMPELVIRDSTAPVPPEHRNEIHPFSHN